MNTYQFAQKNSSIIVTLSANSFEEAEKILFETVISNYGWRFINENVE